jgi:hypothetical protein
MFDLLHKLLGTTFSNDQARNIGALIGAAVAVLVFLLFANIAVWLLGWLWSVSSASPFGAWAFLIVLSMAGGLGYYVWDSLRSEPEIKPAISDEAQRMAERWGREIEAQGGEIDLAERERWSLPQTETPGALKAKAITALNRATTSRKIIDFDEAERLAVALAQYPEMAETADHYQYEIAFFRKRL